MLELHNIIKTKKNANTGGTTSERTVKNHMNILKSLFRTAIELEILNDNTIENIKFTIKEYQVEDNSYDVEDKTKWYLLLMMNL